MNKKEILSWIRIIVVSILIGWAINSFALINITVPSNSMLPLIQEQDRLFAFRMAYTLSKPQRGDVVVYNGTDEDKRLVKRIIGLPGESIEGKGGQVYIDDVLIEDYTAEATDDFGPYQIPLGSYFMMGDNRSNSKDSRVYINKFVPKENFIGKVFIKYYKRIKLF